LNNPEWNAASLIDVAAVKRLAAQANEVFDEPIIEGFVHGDLIPGNLLVHEGRIAAIIDWGVAGRGDTAQDLAPAWAVLTATERAVFREAASADDAAWIRGRTFELGAIAEGSCILGLLGSLSERAYCYRQPVHAGPTQVGHNRRRAEWYQTDTLR